MLSDKILRFNFTENASKKYVLHYLRSHKGRNEIEQKSTGNQMSMRNIGQEKIRQIQFPLPLLPEQHSIVSEIESRLSVCDKLEESITLSLKQAEALRQSILKKAFEGKLVPQDPNDEPASVLLERIRAQKEKNMPEKISKTKKKKQ
jgi:type I restriction enzyme S subunit